MMLLSCKQASQLISQSLDRRLSWRERISLRFHLLICDICKRFSQQLNQLLGAVRQLTQQIERDENLQLSDDAKTRIVEAIASDRK
jgi:hypothetical protein